MALVQPRKHQFGGARLKPTGGSAVVGGGMEVMLFPARVLSPCLLAWALLDSPCPESEQAAGKLPTIQGVWSGLIVIDLLMALRKITC